MKTPQRIVVIGAGITGLAAAYELLNSATESPVSVCVIEADRHVGGVLQTESIDGFTVETSADMFTSDPGDAIELCRELGLDDVLLTATPTNFGAYVATEQGMEPVPSGFSLMLPGNIDAVLASNLLSDSGKARFLQEEHLPPGNPNEDESLESFAVRRFGQEVFDRLIQPLASGIYTADPQALSMRATMDRFLKLEQKHGSLIAAAKHQASQHQPDTSTSGARYGLFRAPINGMGQLVHRLTDRLWEWNDDPSGSIRKFELRNATVATGIQRPSDPSVGRYRIDLVERPLEELEVHHSIVCDGVILTSPASGSAKLLRGLRTEASGEVVESLCDQLESITAASSAVVVMGIESSDLRESDFSAYGIIVPHGLKRSVIAVSFASNKFAGRAPEGMQLVRVFIGGALQGELVDLPDEELEKIAIEELDRLVGYTGKPQFVRIHRWRNSMPQYTLGHERRVEAIDACVAQLSGIELAGKSYRGVGIPACIGSGRAAAKRLMTDSD